MGDPPPVLNFETRLRLGVSSTAYFPEDEAKTVHVTLFERLEGIKLQTLA